MHVLMVMMQTLASRGKPWITIFVICLVTESERQRDARSSAAPGVDVNPSEDLGAVVRDSRSLFDIIVLISRSAWSLLQDGNGGLSSLPAGTSVWCSRLSV